jgi:uncharacterized glyoxalase superfamily protein PhnB
MASAVFPNIQCDQVYPLLAVKDIGDAVEFYTTKLGFRPGFTWGDPPHFAGVNFGDVSVHLSSNMPAAVNYVYFVVSDARELYRFHVDNGVEITEVPADRPYGLHDYRIRDPYGNELGFGHYIYTNGPAIKIERTDVPVRLEKRLAALLEDLAVHKGMSIDSCLEETLLHTFEPVGDGVASPHTKTTIRYIQELKKKHGIDYDTHASYRFTEGP